MTPEEIKAMVGTEFTYVFSDGETVPAFVAAADSKIGLTCKALEQVADRGFCIWDDASKRSDPSGYDNVVCINLSYKNNKLHTLEHMIDRLTKIKRDGKWLSTRHMLGFMASCGF